VYSNGYINLEFLILGMLNNKTSIIVEGSTRNELRRIGRKEQTYDQVIKELIEIKQKLELGIKKSDSLANGLLDLELAKSDYP
jgi:hypothetical protein